MSGRRRNYDVVIAGGGMVGASLACALSGHGLQVAVIEAQASMVGVEPQQPSYDDRKISLALASRHIFNGISVWPLLREQVTAIEHVHVSDRGHFGQVRIHASEQGVPALGYCVEAHRIGHALMQRLADCDDVDWIAPARVTELCEAEPDSSRLSVTIERDGQSRVLNARVLVAADGAHSQVREALGIDARQVDYQQVAVVTNVTPERPHGGWAYERLTSSGPLALLPLSGQRCGVVYTVRSGDEEALLALSDQEFLAALQERFGYRLGRFVKVGERNSYPLHLIEAEQMLGPRSVLIGNAAHTIHPISAQGFNLGLRDAAALAETLVAAHRVGEDLGASALLESYQRDRDPDQQQTIRYTDRLVRLFGQRLLPVRLARNAAMLTMDILPPIKTRLARQTMGFGGKVPRLARGLPI